MSCFNVSVASFALVAALAGCGGGDDPIVIPPTVVVPPEKVVITDNQHVLPVVLSQGGCIQKLADTVTVCTKLTDVKAFVWNSVAVGFGLASIAQADATLFDAHTGTVTIPGTLDTTDQGGWSVIRNDGSESWFIPDEMACDPACPVVLLPGGGKYNRYGTYPGISIVPNGGKAMLWGTNNIWGFMVNGVPIIVKPSDILNQTIYWGSGRAGWTPDTSLAAGSFTTAAADGTAKAVFNYTPDPGENGNFYFQLLDGTVAWMNLGNPDLNCIGCTVDAGQVTFN